MNARKSPIKTICMDNVGEKQVVQLLYKNHLNVNVEMTPPDTPKLNGKK